LKFQDFSILKQERVDAVTYSSCCQSFSCAMPISFAISCGANGSTLERQNKMDRDTYVPVNYISPEACALLAAAEAYAARRANDVDTENMEEDAGYGFSTLLHNAIDGVNVPELSLPRMAPPKKFYRTFWQSISLQLLYRWTQPVTSIGPAPTNDMWLD
jgi:hypothetical protein